jgi:hypothetical protein
MMKAPANGALGNHSSIFLSRFSHLSWGEAVWPLVFGEAVWPLVSREAVWPLVFREAAWWSGLGSRESSRRQR